MSTNKEAAELTKQKEENAVLLDECKNEKACADQAINNIYTEIKQLENDIDSHNQSIIQAMNEASEIKAEHKKYETMLELPVLKILFNFL